MAIVLLLLSPTGTEGASPAPGACETCHQNRKEAQDRKTGKTVPQNPRACNPPPMTGKERVRHFLKSFYDPEYLLAAAAGAGISQAFDYVPEWGQGMEGYGRRYASNYGWHIVKSGLKDGVSALLDQDPRYHCSGRRKFWPRVRHALIQVFVVEKNGHREPAYGTFIGNFGAGFVSRTWFPERYQNVGRGIESGFIGFGYEAATDVFKEFWPDIKRWLKSR